MLAQAGCGRKYLVAVANTLQKTECILGDSSIRSTRGIRQGAPISCLLFVFYLALASARLNALGPDGFLQSLHALFQMDDTVIFATTREKLQEKLQVFYEVAKELDMRMHPSKTRFMTVGTNDTTPLAVGDLQINVCHQYSYLGTPISAKPISKQVKDHMSAKKNQCRKFLSFLSKNYNAPFPVKEKVWESALTSSILYSAETWLTRDLKSVEGIVLSSLKALLGVRITTCTNMVYLETGKGDARSMVLTRQLNWFHKLERRDGFQTSHLQRLISLCELAKTPMGKYLTQLRSIDIDPLQDFLQKTRDKLQASTSSKRLTYLSMNPSLERPAFYYRTDVPEFQRIATTRLRLVSHNLRIETGRWSRLPQHDRLCPCGQIQSEQHVLCSCIYTANIREHYPPTHDRIETIMTWDARDLCSFCWKVLDFYKNN
jgi:hypothetical protein